MLLPTLALIRFRCEAARVIGKLTRKIGACAFGALLAVMVPAAVAHADQKDTEFTSYLAAHGIHLGTSAQTGNMARVMCQDIEQGLTQTDEVNQLTAHGLSQAQAEFFVGAATAEYCPQYRSAPPGSS